MKQWLKSLIKKSRLTSVDDSQNVRVGTVNYLGKTGQKTIIHSLYGLFFNPPLPSLNLTVSQNGQQSNQWTLSDDPENRVKRDLSTGEVGLGNYTTKSNIFFPNNGDVELEGKNLKVTLEENGSITCENLNVIAQNEITFTVGTTIVKIDENGLFVNDLNVGEHIHGQGNDSDGDVEVDTDGPMNP